MSVRRLLDRKGALAVSVPPDTTVFEASRVMAERGFGALLVQEGQTLVGIFTERDVLRRVVVEGRDPRTTAVREVMSTNVVTCLPDTSLNEVGAIMNAKGIRHLPVVDGQGLHGLVSIRDLLASRVAEQEDTIRYLNDYMFSTRAG